MRRLFMSFTLLFVVTYFLSCNDETVAQISNESALKTPDNISNIDYEIYNALLDLLYPNTQLFFLQKTDSNIYWDPEMLKTDYSATDSFAIIAYKENNRITSFLNYQFLINTITLIPDEETDDLTRSKFYQKYPEANGIFTFSKIGFNIDSTQSIIGMSFRGKSSYSSDMTYLLEIENSKWVVKWSGGIATQ